MSEFKNDKKVNESLLYNSNQICQFIKYFTKNFTGEVSQESVDLVQTLAVTFQLSNNKLHPIFGNNLARTTFPTICNTIVTKYMTKTEGNFLKQLFVGISGLLWNLTDSSELFCKEMIACEGFTASIAKIILTTDYSESTKRYVEMALSIVNNTVRRASLRHAFDQFDLRDRIMTIEKSPLLSRDLRIICVAIIFHIVPPERLKEVANLADEVRSDVMDIIEEASQNDTLNSEGFTVKELLEILTVLCRDQATRREAAVSLKLSQCLQRLLAKDVHRVEVVALARAVYDQQKIGALKEAYIAANGSGNVSLINQLQ